MQFKPAILLSSLTAAIGAAAVGAFLLAMPHQASGGPAARPWAPQAAVDAPTHARERLHTVPRLPPGSTDAIAVELAAAVPAASASLRP